jgi:hypothetical protein
MLEPLGAVGVMGEHRVGVVLVPALVDARGQAVGGRDRRRGVALAAQRAGDDARDVEAGGAERGGGLVGLSAAETRQAVVVVGPERRLSVAHDGKQRHRAIL